MTATIPVGDLTYIMTLDMYDQHVGCTMGK
jgi:hypothetical protein